MTEKSKSALLFRKAFIPWYDTEPVMALTLLFAVAVLLFSMAGIAAALDTTDYHPYIWVPGTLGILSLTITLTSLVRLIRRGASKST